MIRIVLFCLLMTCHLLDCHPALLPVVHARDSGLEFKFSSQSEYWPTAGWKRSVPEVQGMKSGPLTCMFKEINQGKYYINSVLVVKNGFLIAEGNRNESGHMGPIWSSTKGITSALVGIALDQGLLKSVDQPVYDFFPHLLRKKNDPRKGRIQVKHLLAMTSGFDWPETESSMAYHRNPEYQMEMSHDWTAYVLGRPMAQSPGKAFNYNSGAYIVLTAVLRKAGMDVEDFARRYLFSPLGILPSHYLWNRVPEGMPNGSHGLVMRPRDMAKIGYLYLKGGHWDGRQIIPEKWIKASTRKQADMNWEGLVADDYGYGWYLQSYGFHTLGYQGQYIFVLPGIDTVVVFTAELALHELELPVHWVETYILPAANRPGISLEDNEAERSLSEEISRFNTTPFW